MTSRLALIIAILTASATFGFIFTPAQASDAGGISAETSIMVNENPIGESFISPITNIAYKISHESSPGKTVYTTDGETYSSIDEILEYEASLFPDGLYKIEPSLRTADAGDELDGRLPVVIFLAPQFGHEVSLNVRESHMEQLESLWIQREGLLEKILASTNLGPVPFELGSLDPVMDAQFRAVDAEYSLENTEMRRQIYRETEKLNTPTQEPIVSKIINLDGLVQYRGPFVNLITARISPDGLKELVKDPSIGSVFRNEIMNARLDVSVPSIGAPSWWSAGYNTATYKLAVADTGIDNTHPALVGKITDEAVFHDEGKLSPIYADNSTDPDDLHGHGTHIAGIVASQDSTYRGVAYGLQGVVNAKFGWLTTTGDGSGTWGDAMKAVDWAINTAGASVISFSFGQSVNGNGNGGFSRFIDAVVDDLGIPYAAAAGNDGPSSGTLGQPADAFNILAVGAINTLGTTSRSDDVIASFSSRGPTTDGRIKPDITAPGADSTNPNWGIYSCNYKWESQSDWVAYPGTSMAAPHIAASTILLLNYFGPRGFFPAIPKALLLENAEDKGPAGPDNNYGWGYVDLNPALANKDKVYNNTVTPSEAKFYMGTWLGGDRATLVWQRHVVYRGSSYPIVYYSLNDLDLFLYNGQTNTLATSSTSSVDNVEQVRSSSPVTSAVLKVKAIGSLSGVTAEPFAVATQRPYTLALPPTYQITWQGPSSVEAGNQFLLIANITNIGDLTSFNTVATLSLPPGLTLIAGANPNSLGTISPSGWKTASWTLRADSVGDKTVNLTVTSNSFGENFIGNGSYTLRVMDSFPPVVNGVWASPSPQNTGLNVNITADITDNLAVTWAGADIVGPTGWLGNFSMSKHPISGLWYVDRPYFVDGLYDVTIWATDIDLWASGQTQFTMVDIAPPNILNHNAQPNPQQIHRNVNVTATVQDQAGIVEVWAEITDPLGGKTNNTMNSINDNYWLDQQYDILGLHGYQITAIDPSDRKTVVSGSFQIVDSINPLILSFNAQPNPQLVFGAINITATITDEGGIVGAWVEITNPVGGKTNTTLNSIGDNYWLEQPYGILGNYNYVISAVDIVSRWAVGSGSFSIVDTVFPIADAGPDQDVTWATVVTFDGSGSWDNFGISSYMWTFNDQGLVTLTGVSPSYQFFNPGTFVVTLTVTDYSSNSDTDTMNVTVRDITPPRITNVSATPNPQNIGGSVDIKATVRDNVGVAGVWIRITDPYGFTSNVSMPLTGVDEYSLMQSYSVLGPYSFEISATDTSNNWNKSSGWFEIKDLVAPIFISVNALPNPQEILYSVQISANIQDNRGVNEAWVEITEPDSSFAGNFSMTYDSGLGIWRRNFLTGQLGLHSFTVFARDIDPARNWNSSSGQFFVQDTTPPTIRPSTSLLRMEVDVPFNFTAMASDNFRIDEVFAELESPASQIDNYSMNYGVGIGTNYYLVLTLSELGDYQVYLSVKDIAGNWGTTTAVITVVDSYPPTAEAGPDQYVTEGDLVQFDGSGSTDSHAIESYEWRFVEDSQQRILYGPRPVYTYSTAGTYDVTLIVTDYAGGSDSDSLRVFVNPKTTGNGEDGDQKGLWDTIVNDILIRYYWLIILLMTVLIVLIVSVAAKRRSDKKKARARKAARARQRARMETEAQAREVPPPPDDELPPPPSEEDFAPPPPPPT